MTVHQYFENIRMGLENLRAYKLRSSLTVLGVVLGVGVVIVVASILTGLRYQVLSQVEQFGTDNIYVIQFAVGVQVGRRAQERLNDPMEVSYVDALKEQSQHIRDVAYQSFGADPVVKTRSREFHSANFGGVSPNLAETTTLLLNRGRFISEVDEQGRRPVAVIGPAVVEALYPRESDVLGKTIRIQGQEFFIVGILDKGKEGLDGSSRLDSSVFIPYRTFKKLYPRNEFLQIVVRARPNQLAEAHDETEEILRRLRGLKAGDDNNFSLVTYDTVVEIYDQLTYALTLLTLGVAGVALLVGGIGVMNIMLVSVTERTREIGVRKALGARRADIVFQFLFEAMTLTVVGGLVGVIVAVPLGFLLVLALFSVTSFVPMWALATALGVSAAVGLIFGVFPAFKAALLDPIECLRYE
ncbi:MAG TPA: ABC transporter permease [Acidobacteriota bacterium]|nr:ABC transporter permease [Acidobacteriota bacterium]